MQPFEAVKLTDKVYWVGAIDWSVRNFHGFLTDRGTTYNAYLILAEKVTLVDTVKAPFFDEMMTRIASVIEPSKIDYLVSNHAEMDHSGALPATIAAVTPEKVFASSNGVKALSDHYHMDREIIAVKDSETIALGDLNVTCYETRMIHWPDSMMSYIPEEKVLFCQDGFGMHLASTERFDDELDAAVLEHEAAKYFANILLPFSPIVTKLIARLCDLKLDVAFLAPDHGPVWRKDIVGIIARWGEWAEQKPAMKAVVAFDTMWGSTEKLARSIADGLAQGGVSPKVMSLTACHRSDVALEILDAGAFLVGSPTFNNQLFPTVADCLAYLKGLRPRNLVGAAFGSYGWSAESVKYLEAELDAMKVERVAESLNVKYVPDDAALVQARKLGLTVAAKLAEKVAGKADA